MFLAFSTLEMLRSLHFSNFVAILADFNKFARIFSDFVEIQSEIDIIADKRCNFSKILDFFFDLIFKSI